MKMQLLQAKVLPSVLEQSLSESERDIDSGQMTKISCLAPDYHLRAYDMSMWVDKLANDA
jgi:hypothetical protein